MSIVAHSGEAIRTGQPDCSHRFGGAQTCDPPPALKCTRTIAWYEGNKNVEVDPYSDRDAAMGLHTAWL